MATLVPWGVSDFALNAFTTLGSQKNPKVVGLKDGSFLAVWDDASSGGSPINWNIRGQIFNADGTLRGTDFIVNGTLIGGALSTADAQQTAQVAVLSDGRFVVTWVDKSIYVDGIVTDAEGGIRARIFNLDGTPVGPDFKVNGPSNYALPQNQPSIAATANGGFVISYTSTGPGGNSWDVIVQGYDASGAPIGSEFTANATTVNPQWFSSITGLKNGGYVVVYSDYSSSADDPTLTIRGRIFNPDPLKSTGVTGGAEFLIPSSRAQKAEPVVTLLADGRFVVVWSEPYFGDPSLPAPYGDGSDDCLKGQIFNADGTKYGGEFLVNSFTNREQVKPSVVALPDGGFAVSYGDKSTLSNKAIGIALFDSIGSRIGLDYSFDLPDTVNFVDGVSSLAVLGDGRLVLSWAENGSPRVGDADGVWARILDPRTSGVTVTGQGHDDQFIGTAFNDSISGKAGADLLLGDAGDDTLIGGAGGDVLNGGFGRDTASYKDADAPVVANLANAGSNAGDAVGDTYISIENLQGSSFGDELTGDDEANTLDGGAGADTLMGGRGADRLEGGADNDTLDGGIGADTMIGGTGSDLYYVDDAGDVVEEAAGGGNDEVITSISYALSGNQEVETLRAVAGTLAIDLKGNNIANRLFGNNADNVLDGGLGADRMEGGIGNDTYVVDNATDVVVEQAGNENGYDTVVIGSNFAADSKYDLTTFANVEALSALDSAGAITLIGNNLANVITGNDSANTLDGGIDSVIDTLKGGKGNDTYIIRDESDLIDEAAGEGTDTASVRIASYELANDMSLEVLQADKSGGVSAFTLTGNNLANTIKGADGSDTLDGGGTVDDDADRLEGGSGDDVYKVRHKNDIVVEGAGEGENDKVIAYTDYTLGDGSFVEIMEAAAGTQKISLIGNIRGTTLLGNDGDNVLEGRGGNDIIDGGEGLDTAVFTGKKSEYTITRHGDGSISVADKQSGRDGTDLLKNIDYIRFNDEIVHVGAQPAISISPKDAVKDEGNSGSWTDFTFTVTRNSDVGTSTVDWEVAGFGASAAGAEDFDPTTMQGTVSFADSETSKVITVRVKVDAVPENSEGFQVTLSNATGATLDSASSATAVILNDDNITTLSIAAMDAARSEGDSDTTDYTFTVTRSSGVGTSSAVWKAAGSGTNAASDDDFASLSGVVEFAAGETSKTITVKVKGDTSVEQNEGFTVTLSGATDATIGTASANGVILNDDALPVLSIAAMDAMKAEGDAGLTEYTFTVTRNSGVGSSTVDWQVAGMGTNPASDDEFDALSGTVTFADGEVTQTIVVRVRGDEAIEPTETFMVTLRNPTNATIATGIAIGTIVGDDLLDAAPSNIRLTTGGTSASVEENKAGGHVVGTVTADDDKGSAGLRYSLSNEYFDIDSVSGQIKVKSDVTLDYEKQGTFVLAVTATDLNGSGQSKTQNITINLVDLNERASDITFSDDQVLKVGATGAGSRVTLASAVDLDAGIGFSANLYRFDNGQSTTPDGLFVINANTGEITTTRALTAADVGPKTLNVVAYDATNSSLAQIRSHAVTILAPDNVAPNGLALDQTSIAENSAGKSVIGKLSAADADAGDTLTYSILTDLDGKFDIIGGNLVLKEGATLDYEAKGSHKVTVRVTDSKNLSYDKEFTIDVGDVNDAPTHVGLSAASIDEGAASDTFVGNLLTTDEDASGSYAYELLSGADGRFKLSADGKSILVADGSKLDYETASFHTIRVKVKDGSLSRVEDIIIDLNNKLEAGSPSIIVDPALKNTRAPDDGTKVNPFTGVTFFDPNNDNLTVRISFKSSAGQLLIREGLEIPEPELGDDGIIIYTFTGSYDALAIIMDVLQFQATPRPSLQVGTAITTTFTIEAFDGTSLVTNKEVKVSAVATNRAPTGVTLDNSHVSEITGGEVGILSASDQAGDEFTYELIGTADGRFKLETVTDSAGKTITKVVAVSGLLLDYEQVTSHTIRVKVTDKEGASYEKNLEINVDNVAVENINGSAGNDVFVGGAGRDTLRGFDGDDTLNGGAGIDVLWGGSGKDVFVFNKAPNSKSNKDKIADWTYQDDTVHLENAIFKKLSKTGVLSKANFVLSATAKDKKDFIGYDKKTGDLWYDSNGSSSGGKVVFANIGVNKKIYYNDFLVI